MLSRACRKQAVWRDPAKGLVRNGSCPVLGFRDRLPGGLGKQSRTPAAGRLDRDTDDETGIQRGGTTTGTIKV